MANARRSSFSCTKVAASDEEDVEDGGGGEDEGGGGGPMRLLLLWGLGGWVLVSEGGEVSDSVALVTSLAKAALRAITAFVRGRGWLKIDVHACSPVCVDELALRVRRFGDEERSKEAEKHKKIPCQRPLLVLDPPLSKSCLFPSSPLRHGHTTRTQLSHTPSLLFTLGQHRRRQALKQAAAAASVRTPPLFPSSSIIILPFSQRA